MIPKVLLLAWCVVVAATLTTADSVAAHQNGCHHWHSCPSDDGSYWCGDLGYTIYCPGEALDGNTAVYGEDGVFLGVISSDSLDPNSICNAIGLYGGELSVNSVRNTLGLYGSYSSDLSASNPNARRPPVIVDASGRVIGYLTVNVRFRNGVDPGTLFYAYGC